MTEPTATAEPATTEQALEASRARIAATFSKEAKTVDVPGPSVPAKVSDQAPAADVKPVEAATPTETPAPDLSHIPEKYRGAFDKIDPEALKWQRDIMLRRAKEAATKTDEERKAQEAVQKAAENWQALVGDREAMDALLRYQQGRLAGADVPAKAAPPFGWTDDADENARIDAEVNRRIEAAAAKAEATAKTQAEAAAARFLDEKVIEPSKRTLAITESLTSYAEENGIDPEIVATAAVAAVQHYEAEGILARDKWTAKNALGLVKPFLASVAAQKNGASKVERKATPPPPGTASVAPSPMPAYKREGRAPSTYAEKAEAVAELLSQTRGVKFSRSDIEAITSGATPPL